MTKAKVPNLPSLSGFKYCRESGAMIATGPSLAKQKREELKMQQNLVSVQSTNAELEKRIEHLEKELKSLKKEMKKHE